MKRDLINLMVVLMIPLLMMQKLPAQFAPPAGQPGTTAIARDSSIIIDWAKDCQVWRGFINIADTTASYNGFTHASYGSVLYASGPSDEYVLSLGDHGYALLTFNSPIVNKTGPDFAVFENSFGDFFLELAFVEVSSDGENFVRFPAVSFVPENVQVETFGTIDARLIHNFAGKYRMGYGTPFDLEDLRDSARVDLNHITHIIIRDAGGSIDPLFATYDSQGHKVNDPWPTPFDTGGFDLDAIGVIHNTVQGACNRTSLDNIRLFPNPFADHLIVEPLHHQKIILEIYAVSGKLLFSKEIREKTCLTSAFLNPGIYMARIIPEQGNARVIKLIKK